MNNDVKKQISEALREYAKEKSLSQDQLAQITGLNISYINAVLSGDLKVGKTNIKEAYLKTIADLVGVNTEKEYVPHVDTVQYDQIYSELLDAKVSGRVKIIISRTGFGKTYTVNQFQKKHPGQTYKITLNSLYKLPDILDDLCSIFNVDMTRSFGHPSRLREISRKLKIKKDNGGTPTIIFDEAENAKASTLRMLKAFYDEAHQYCSIVLIGTPQLITKLDRLRKNDVEGMSQFYRRFKAGIREFTDIDKDKHFDPFLVDIEDENLCELLKTLSDNYGELTDYIGHALKEADRMGLPLTEQLFRNLFGLNRD